MAGRFVSPFTPRSQVGSDLSGLMAAMFATGKSEKPLGTGEERRSDAQDIRDRAEAAKAQQEALAQQQRTEGRANFLPNAIPSAGFAGDDVPIILDKLKTGRFPAREDERQQMSLVPDVPVEGWNPEREAKVRDLQLAQAMLLPSDKVDIKDLSGAIQAPAQGRRVDAITSRYRQPQQRAPADDGMPQFPLPRQAMPVSSQDAPPDLLPIDANRPIINNADGSFSTEKTITIEADGKHFLIPTIVNGKELAPDAAVAAWRDGVNNEVGVYNSAPEAERAATMRSQKIGQVRAPQAPMEPEQTLDQVDVNGRPQMNLEQVVAMAQELAQAGEHEMANSLIGGVNASRQLAESDRKAAEEKIYMKPVEGLPGILYHTRKNAYFKDGVQLTADQVLDLARGMKKAGANNQQIDVNAFDKTGGAERAKAVQERQTAAMKTHDFATTVETLADVLEGYGGGPLTQFQAQIGSVFPESEYGKVASVNDLARGITGKAAPMIRATGSGATSDFEMKQFMAALPGLASTPEGRQFMRIVARKVADREVEASDIYGELAEKGPVRLGEWRRIVRERMGDLFTPEDRRMLRSGSTQAPAAQPSRQELEAEAKRRGLLK